MNFSFDGDFSEGELQICEDEIPVSEEDSKSGQELKGVKEELEIKVVPEEEQNFEELLYNSNISEEDLFPPSSSEEKYRDSHETGNGLRRDGFRQKSFWHNRRWKSRFHSNNNSNRHKRRRRYRGPRNFSQIENIEAVGTDPPKTPVLTAWEKGLERAKEMVKRSLERRQLEEEWQSPPTSTGSDKRAEQVDFARDVFMLYDGKSGVNFEPSESQLSECN